MKSYVCSTLNGKLVVTAFLILICFTSSKLHNQRRLLTLVDTLQKCKTLASWSCSAWRKHYKDRTSRPQSTRHHKKNSKYCQGVFEHISKLNASYAQQSKQRFLLCMRTSTNRVQKVSVFSQLLVLPLLNFSPAKKLKITARAGHPLLQEYALAANHTITPTHL